MKGHQLRQALLIAAGLTALGLGIVGVVVPLLPTTPFLLLAAACVTTHLLALKTVPAQ